MESDYKFLALEALRAEARRAIDSDSWPDVKQHAIAFQQLSMNTSNLPFIDFQRATISRPASSELANVDLHLNTNLSSKDGQTFCPDWRADPDRLDHYRRRVFAHNGTDALICAPSHVVASNIEVVDLTHVWSRNWFHFLVETVSFFATPEVRDSNLKILMNRTNLSGSFIQTLQTLAPECLDRIIPAGDWGKVECKTLIQPDGIWVPSYDHKQAPKGYYAGCGFTNYDAARALYKRAWPNRRPLKTKIVIERPEASVARCENQTALIELFRERGYRVVSPEEMSFSEQATVFYDADVIVGISGAAFANLVFCRPGTRVICARSVESGSGTYSQISKAFDLDFSDYDAEVTSRSPIRDYARFIVDPEEMHSMSLQSG